MENIFTIIYYLKFNLIYLKLQDIARNSDSLNYEKEMTESSIKEYQSYLNCILNSVKNDPIPIFELSLWLLRKGKIKKNSFFYAIAEK